MSSCCRIGCNSCHFIANPCCCLCQKHHGKVACRGRGGADAARVGGTDAARMVAAGAGRERAWPGGRRRGEGAHPTLSRAAEAYEAITAPALAGRTPALAGDARRGGGSHQVEEHGGNGKTDGRPGKW